MTDSAETNAFEGGLPRRTRGKPRKSLLGDTGSSAASSPAPSATVPRSRAKKLNGSLAISVLGSESVSSAQTPGDQSPESDEYSTPATSKLPTPAAQDLPGTKTIPSGGAIEVRLPAATRGKSLRNSKYAMTSRRTADEIADSEEDELMSDYSPDALVARRLQREEDEKARPRFSKLSSIESAGRPEAGLLPRDVSAKRGRASTSSLPATERPGKKSKTEDGALDLDAEYARALEYGSDEDSMANPMPLPPSSDPLDEMSEIQSPLSALTDSEDEPISSRAKVAKSRLAKGQNDTASANTAVDLTTAGSTPALANTPVLSGDESDDGDFTSGLSVASMLESPDTSEAEEVLQRISQQRRAYRRPGNSRRVMKERDRLENHHPEIKTMWDDLEKMPILKAGKAQQPQTISRQLKPFQLEGLAWMKEMEKTEWRGGLLGDEMGLGKTIQAVSLIMSDYPAKQPSLVLVPPVALMQWQSEIGSYTDGTLKTFVYHGTNQKAKGMTVSQLKKYDVIMMSYNSLESMYRKQEKGFKRKDGIYKERSVIHSTEFHRIILDEAHSIKTRSTTTARACFALKTQYRWCLTGTPLQNRIGEFFSLIRFLNIRPFASYLCKQCPCSTLEWSMDENKRCSDCRHASMQHVSVFNQELLNPIQKFGNLGPGREAFRKLRLMTDRIMLRRLKKDHTNAMELPVKEIYVNRQFFGEEENDFANSIMTSGQRKFDTYVAQGVLLNNYANIFGLIMQMRQVADHPDLILKKNAEGGQNVLVCCICDEPAEDTVRSRCKHDFCRACVASYVRSTDEPDCPRCHISLAIDLEQPEIEQDESLVKKSSIINRIKMENWTSSSKIELLVHELHKLRSDNATHKSIIFSQFTTMLQLIEWRLRRAGITTVMLDGSMTPAQRQASIEHFMNNVEVECFLVSLKAGGVALNLTEASRVFIVDP
jgi:DNA repair protein RAD16